MMTMRALPGVARHAIRTMPWATLLTGCLAGIALIAVIAAAADASHQPLGQDSVRLAFPPALAGLAFVARGAFRPLTLATPVPAWLGVICQVVLAVPVLSLTCWVQLRITAHTVPDDAGPLPAQYPLLAQLAGWSAITIAIAAGIDRSRFAELAGAAAAPISLAVIAIGWYAPVLHRLLLSPPASAAAMTTRWYAVVAIGVVLTGFAVRDRWHRYSRRLRRAG